MQTTGKAILATLVIHRCCYKPEPLLGHLTTAGENLKTCIIINLLLFLWHSYVNGHISTAAVKWGQQKVTLIFWASYCDRPIFKHYKASRWVGSRSFSVTVVVWLWCLTLIFLSLLADVWELDLRDSCLYCAGVHCYSQGACKHRPRTLNGGKPRFVSHGCCSTTAGVTDGFICLH